MVAQVRLKRKSQTNNYEWLTKATNSFFDRILRAVFVTLLFVLDFVMFVYSIHGRILEDGVVNEAMIYIGGGLFAFFLLVMLLLSASGMAQNIVCSLFVFLITLIFLNQFALFDLDNFIEVWLEAHASFLTFICLLPSAWMVGLFLALLVFFAFRYTLVIFVTVAALAGSVGIGVYKTETANIPQEEYVTVKELNAAGSNAQNKNLVYIMAPKFPSYHFLSTIKDINFRELRDLMIGFYAVNDFEIYPNAFVQKNDTVSNIVDIYNQVNYGSTTSGIRGYAEILNDWNFIHHSLDTMELEDNKLFAILSKDGYKVSTYPMPLFNFCYKNGQMLTDRCVVKQTHPIKLYDKKSPLEKNIYALLGEWVMSLKSRELKSAAKMFIDMSYMRGWKILSENRRLSIEGTPVLLDRVYEDFAKDGNGVAYMSFVELPSDLYIYDEFCNLKPRNKWVALKDNSLYSGGIDEKRKAYADQAKCLIGMLQMYMEKMRENDKLQNTDIIVQGVSPLRELAGMPAGQYGTFVADKLVSLGIRRGENPNFIVNTEICLASDFTRSLITKEKACYTIDNMKMSTEDAHNLKQNLINNSVIRGSKISNIAANYRDWYEEFRQRNPQYQAMLKRLRETQNKIAAEPARVIAEPVAAAQPVQPATEQAAEQPAAEQPVEPVIEQLAVPATEQLAVPAAEQPVEPVVEQPAVTVTEQPAESVPEQSTEPKAEPVAEQPAEPIAEPVVEQPSESVSEQPAAPEQSAEPVAEQTAEPIVEPVAEQSAEPAIEQPAEPAVEQSDGESAVISE